MVGGDAWLRVMFAGHDAHGLPVVTRVLRSCSAERNRDVAVRVPSVRRG